MSYSSKMVLLGGFEPRVPGLRGQCPDQLDDRSKMVDAVGLEPTKPALKTLSLDSLYSRPWRWQTQGDSNPCFPVESQAN